ncbi:alpha/beta hydrolase domain-containing protein [Paraburkholderia sp. ZP32-5]|uniref:alpha/beta hydrolase domain-containing protein n=1 Tax=Paraburkholderia sp. ZP32-5 TaxID=2883245 RepID=UPI001F3C5C2C|nr:alpha/beta hydrolase domain-containing protein [Paraburkholderia sp. ZP32-5]
MPSSLRYTLKDRRLFANGHEFGNTGPYELLSGEIEFQADPDAPDMVDVVDIDKAARNENGLVVYRAGFNLLKPIDISKSNGRLFFDYGNRGNKRALQFFNDAKPGNLPVDAVHAGNGFLMRRGYVIAWLGWQGDLLPGEGRLVLEAPTATDGAEPIRGWVRTEYVATAPDTFVFPLSSLVTVKSYPTSDMNPAHAQLTRRRYALSRREVIPAHAWSFARLENGIGVDSQGAEQGIVPSNQHLYLHAGFEPGWIYELSYVAQDPLVLGLGHVAVRDFVSFLKFDDEDASGQPNPLGQGASRPEKVYAWGRSQTGRAIRDFVYGGFNADAKGRRVFDGVMPHVAGAGKLWMNQRFANISVLPGQQYENHFTPADRFPFSYAACTDAYSEQTDAILKRPATDPLVIHTDSSSEYWHRRASLVLTDTQGRDLPQPDNVRIYLWSSSQHFAAPGPIRPTAGISKNYQNNVSTSFFFRALLDCLDAWATYGTPPPASRIPLRSTDTLVDYDTWRTQFPSIPGQTIPPSPSTLEVVDFGPDLKHGKMHREPRFTEGKAYPIFVPAVDRDGLDIAGVRAPAVSAPLGTYVGWSMRRRELGNGAMVGTTGSYIPLPESPEEQHETGDPRRSILSRYRSAEGYLSAIGAAANALVGQRFMLEEDRERAIEDARNWGRPRHDTLLGADEMLDSDTPPH